MKHKICSLFLAALLILTLIPGSVFALAEDEQGHNHVDGYCYVCGQGDPYARNYNVPQYTEDGTSVVYIGDAGYQSLGEAVQAAQPGDRLDVVADITLSDPILIDKTLTLAGQGGVTITRNFSGEAMFTVTSGVSLSVGYVTIDGGADRGYSGYSIFDVVNGSALGLSSGTVLRNSHAGYGGAVYVEAYSTVQMNSGDPSAPSRITQCSADHSGGAIYSEGTVQILQGSSITGNQAAYGGGIWSLEPIYTETTEGIYDNSDNTGNGDIRIASEEESEETTPVTHTVYFDLGDGVSELYSFQVADGDTVQEPASVTREGYDFTGWIYDPYDDGQAYPYDFSTPVYSDFTITATWQQQAAPETEPEPAPETEPETETETETEPVTTTTWLVDFDFGAEGFYADAQPVPDGGYAKDPYNPDTMQRDGYAWGGWYYYTGDGAVPFSFDQPVTQDYYLTANWIEEETTPVTYTVNYDPNDGVNGPTVATVTAGGAAQEPAASRPGYTFSGWYYYNEYGEYVPYDFTLPMNGDLTLYAEWEAIPQYTVYFDFNADGTIAPVSQTVESGETVVNPYDPETMTRDGYSWLGWFYTDEYGDEYPFDFDYQITSDWEIYSKWSRNTYQVTYDFNADGEIPAETLTVDAGDSVTPPNIAREGYDLENWYIDTADGRVVYDWGTPVNSDITLIAQWTPIETEPETEPALPVEALAARIRPGVLRSLRTTANEGTKVPDPIPTYTVTWQNYDGAVLETDNNVAVGTTPEYNGETPVKPADGDINYTFIGWDPAVKEADEDITYTAVFVPDTVSITYYANSDENIVKTQTVGVNTETALAANTFTYKDHSFNGWNTEADGSGTSYEDEAAITLDENLVLYAQWVDAYTVTWENYDETVLKKDEDVPEGELPKYEGATPTKPEDESFIYTFDKWTPEIAPVAGNVVYNATFTETPKTYVATLDQQGGTGGSESVSVDYGQSMPSITLPSRIGYKFDGYYSEASGGGTKYYDENGNSVKNYDLEGNTTLYANWIIQYTVTWKNYDNTVLATQELMKGDTPSYTGNTPVKPEDESNTYTFSGWTPEPAAISDNVEYTATYTATPKETVTVTFDMAGYKDNETKTIVKGSTVTPPELPTEITGVTFDGWYTDSTYTTNFDFSTPINADTTIVLKWSRVVQQITLNFDSNGGSGTIADITGDVDSEVALPDGTAFTRTGYSFVNWKDGEGNSYDAGASFKLSDKTGSEITLYAQWEVVTFTVTFVNNYNDSVYALETINYGQNAFKPKDPTRAGYTFVTWCADAQGVNVYDFTSGVYTNLTLFAKWEPTPVQYYNVSFSTERGTAPATQSVQQGQRAYKPADPVADGYLFGGWYLDQTYATLYNFNNPVTGNITLYAKWAARPDQNHVVSFNANGHGNAPNPQTVQGGAAAQRPEDPSAVGYTFTGWYTDPQCTQAYNFQSAVTTDFTLYAGWTVNRYTIRFDSNGGVGTMSSITCAYDQKTVLPSNTFTQSGYYFVGWNTAKDGSGTYIANQGQVLNLTETNGATVDLFAQWKNIYNVIEGANARIMKGGSSGFTFRTDGDYSKFTGIQIDGRTVGTAMYTSYAGSTVVTLHQDYVEQLSTGNHTIKFMYTDGSVETDFEIMSRTPRTGDTNNTLIWIIIGIAALLVIGVVITLLIRRRRMVGGYDDGGPDDDGFYEDYDDYDDSYDDRTGRSR